MCTQTVKCIVLKFYTFSDEFRVRGLPTRKKCKFRVLAENLAGPGKPSKETDQIMIKDPIGKINDLTVDHLNTI